MRNGRKLSRLVLSVIILISLVMPSLSVSAATPDINNFRLNYSTLGYDTRATKQILVRTLTSINEADVSLSASSWSLKNTSGVAVATGNLSYRGMTYGIQYWGIDFSSYNVAGTYYMEVLLKKDASTTIGTKTTLNFKIQTDIFYNNVLIPLSLNNAESRMAPPEKGNGYFDCSASEMGESNSHGMFMNGLLQLYKYKQSSLSTNDKNRLIAAAARAFDYDLQLWTASGQFLHEHYSRPIDPNLIFGGMYDIEALYGMSAYIDIFKTVDPARANTTNYNKLVTTYNYLKTHPTGIAHWLDYDEYQDHLIPIAVHLYNYSGDVQWKNEAISRLNSYLDNFNLRAHYRNPFRGIPLFDGLKACVEAFPADPNYSSWISKATRIKDTYYRNSKIMNDNAFNIINTSARATAASDWDNGNLTSDEWGNLVVNETAATYAADVLILAKITHDKTLERIAAGEIGWVMGINPGIPQYAIQNPTSTTDRESASFIHKLNARHSTQVYNPWWAPTNSTWMSILNGFSKGWILENNYFNIENFIKHDGCFIYSALLYEDYLSIIASEPTPPANPTPGYIYSTMTIPSSSINLSTEGALDWAHWGLTDASSFNHKSGVNQQISNYSLIGNGAVARYANGYIGYSWTGGTPTASATNSITGIYVTGTNNGFQVTVPADTTRRTLKMYVGAYNAKVKVEAKLNDGSTMDYLEYFENAVGATNRLITLNYRAVSSGKTLTFKITTVTDFGGGGNVTLQGASLSSVGTGYLSGNMNSTASSANLSTEGTLDWAHWGLTNASSFDHKSGVTQQISNYSLIGSGTVTRYSNCNTGYTWTGGTPTASATNSTTGIYVTGINNGFQVTVPADTTRRTLKMYVGAYNAKVKVEAILNDGSADNYTAYIDNATGSSNKVITLSYNAASVGKTLTFKVTTVEDYGGGGNVTLQSATLQ